MKKKHKPKRFYSKLRKTGNGISLYLPKDILRELDLEDKVNWNLRAFMNADGMLVFDPKFITKTKTELKEYSKQYDNRRNEEKKNELADEISAKVIQVLENKIGEHINVEQLIIKEEKGKTEKVKYENTLDDDLNFMESFNTKDLAKVIKDKKGD